MTDMSTPEHSAPGWLRRRTAEEIRVLLARRRMSAAELARLTGIKQSTLGRRMTGETAFDLDDLQQIAHVLGVEVIDLLPRHEGASPRDRETEPVPSSATTPSPVPAPEMHRPNPTRPRPKPRPKRNRATSTFVPAA